MSITFNSYQALIIPIMILFAVFGARRGLWLEVGTAAFLGLVLLITVQFPEQFFGFINRIIVNIPRVIGVLLGTDAPNPLADAQLFGTPGSLGFLAARVVFFILFTVLIYTNSFPWELGGDGKARLPKTPIERATGALLGAVIGLFFFVAVSDFLEEAQAILNIPSLPLEGTNISLPEAVDLGLLISLVPVLIVVLLVVLGILALIRLPRLWSDPPGPPKK